MLEDFDKISGKCQHSSLFKDTSRNALDSKLEQTILSRADDLLADTGGGRISQTLTKDMPHAHKTTRHMVLEFTYSVRGDRTISSLHSMRQMYSS